MAACETVNEYKFMTSDNNRLWLMYTVVMLLALFGISGNALVIYAFRRVGIKAPYQLFTVALAVNDLVMCTLCTPTLPLLFTGVTPVYVRVIDYSLYGYVFCNNASFFILIAVYRLVAVLKRVPGHFSMSVARCFCVGSFMFSLLPFTIRIFGRFGYPEAALGGCVYGLLQYFLALAVTSGCYITVYLRIGPCRQTAVTPSNVTSVSVSVPMITSQTVSSTSLENRASFDKRVAVAGGGLVTVDHAGSVSAGSHGNSASTVQQIQLGKSAVKAKKAGFTLLVSTMVFLICFAPTVLGDHLGLFPAHNIRFLIFIQNVTNPVIYYITQPKFKSEVKRVFRRCCSCFFP